jgi:uncharacterized membrane protein YbhN (UPF0104 family)
MSAPPTSAAPPLPRFVVRVVLVMLFAVALYGALVLWRGIGEVRARFATFAWWTFAAACGLAFLNYLVRFAKWELYLAWLGIRGLGKLESLLTFLSGFVLTVTPGKVGEVFKSVVLYRTRGVPIERSAPIVVAERVTDVIGVLIMIAIGSLGFPGGLWWAIAGALLCGLLLGVVASPRLSAALLRPLARVPGRIGARLVPRLELALAELRGITTPRRLVWPTVLSVVGWSLEGVALWLILRGLGTPAPLPLAAFFYATATLAGAIVPVPGGLGVTDKLLEEQLAGLGGVPSSAATVAMLLVRLATLWFAVLVGFTALALLRWRHPALRASGAAPPRADG